MNKDDSFCPVSTPKKKYKAPSDEPVRIQGKNGVLKLMIRTKKVGEPDRTYGHVEGDKAYRSDVTKAQLHPPIYEEKFLRNPHSVGVTEKNQMNPKTFSISKKNKIHDSRTKDGEKFLLLGSTSSKTCSSKKDGRNIRDSNLTSEFCPPSGRKVGEVRRGIGTQKQLIRERIRRMLEKAGWAIDFRPRKNRNYQDAVYTNPSGTEYWSILNAYYALKKEYEDVGSDHKNTGATFTPIPEEVLSQLTRQTRKKIEREERMMNRVCGGKTNVKETIGKKSANHMRRKENGFVSQNMKAFGKNQKYIHPLDAKGCGSRVQKPSFAPDGHLLQGKKSKKQNRCALLVRTSKKGVNADDNDFIPSSRRLTVLSWLIDSGIVSLSEKVKYMNKKRTQTLLRGWIARDGIHCACCSKILTVSKFEIHAGSKLRQPYQNICVESGDSLLQCQLDAWNDQDESKRSGFCLIDVNGDDPNDDTCGICADGGDLICCDGCPSTFHQRCLGIKVLPPGDWHCSSCSCKFCGLTGNNCQGDDNVSSELLACSSCEEKYHPLCIQQTNNAVVDSKNSSTSFCGHKCRELFEQLQKLLWVKHDLKAGFSWTLIQRCALDSDTSLPGLPRKAECNSKLAVALTVMDECFFPIVDRRSGIRLIDNVLYNCGSNFNRLNYSGFYTAVLERGDEIISAASIRIHGTRLAEMPFIGTRHIYRRQGMCRRLLNAIESALCSLKVEKLIIPAISELMHAWTTVFGFNALEEPDKQEMRSLNMLMFPGTDLLQKLLLNPEENVTSSAVMETVQHKNNDHFASEERDISEPHSSARPDNSASCKAVRHEHEINDEVVPVETGFQASDGSTHNTFDRIGIPLSPRYENLSHEREETVCSSQPEEKLPESAPDTKSLCSVATYHHKLEVKNKVILETVEPNPQFSVEGASGDVHEVNAAVTGV